MTNRIPGYSAGAVNPYRPTPTRSDSPPETDAPKSPTARRTADRANLGPDLTEEEARMIGRSFPESEAMKLRLYGPSRTNAMVDAGERGRRLDLKG